MLPQLTSLLESLPKKSLNSILELTSNVNYNKGDVVIKVGDCSKNIFFIKKGIVRSVFTNNDGKQYTRSIITNNKSFASPESLYSNSCSTLYYECLTDCELKKLKFDSFKELCKKDIHVSLFYNELMELILIEFLTKVHDLSILDGKERYLRLKNSIPDIEEIMPQYQIASYLNITPVQLSRIKRKIYSK